MDIPLPQVISGFKPDQLLHATLTLLELIKNKETRVVNDYPEVVFRGGNPIAKKMIKKTLKPADAERGLVEPRQCPLFGTVCTPENPKGACMVSDSEGACAIAYKYGKSLAEV